MDKYASLEEVQKLYAKSSTLYRELFAQPGPPPKMFDEYEGMMLPPEVAKVVGNLKTWEVREDDVWIVTYPKAGTTWAQEIASAVMHGGNLEEVNKRHTDFRVPFLEMNLPEAIRQIKNIPETHKILDEIPSPRIIKSHLPGQLLPFQIWEKKPKIIYVIRNPKDLTVSFFYFIRMMAVVREAVPSFEDFVDGMLTGKAFYGAWWDHYLYFWRKRHDQNILFLRYENMKRDLRGNVETLSRFLGKNLSAETLDAITEHCTFDNMKKNPMTNLGTLVEKIPKPEGASFMRKGQVGDWKHHFTVAQNEAMDALIRDKLRGTGLMFVYD